MSSGMQAESKKDELYGVPEPLLEEKLKDSIFQMFFEHVTTYWRGVMFAFTWHTLFLVTVTCLATLACSKGVLDFSFDTSMSIVAVGTVFPLVFSVQAAFARRENVLNSLYKIKAAAFTIYLMFRSWEKEKTGQWPAEAEKIMHKLLDDMEWYFRCDERKEETSNIVYDGFSSFAAKIFEFGPEMGYPKGGEGGMGRLHTYLRTMMVEFEQVRSIRDSETPSGLRLFCFALIHIAPIVLAPYWIHFCAKQSTTLEESFTYGCEAAYFVAITYVVIVMTLYRVQRELEDPFDGKGDDDINWENWRSQLGDDNIDWENWHSQIDQLGNYGEGGPKKRQEMARYLSESSKNTR